VDMGLYGNFLSPASKRKVGMSVGRGHECAGDTFSAGTNVNGASEVSPKTKKPRRFGGN
jgi:hypothetical protein